MYNGDHKKGEIEIIRSVSVFSNRYINIFNDDVMFPGGNEGTYIRISNPTPRSVAVLPVTRDGRIVVIRTFRHGVRGWGYEIPKGGIEEGETPEDAAARELAEETGFTAERLIYIDEYADSPAVFTGKMTYYLAVGCFKSSDIKSEPTEAIACTELFSPEEFMQKSGSLDFKDAVTELMIRKYLDSQRGE